MQYGRHWNCMELLRIWQNMVEHCPELNGNLWKQLETTCIIHGPGSVNPYSYPCHHARPRDLWCQGRRDVKTGMFSLQENGNVISQKMGIIIS